MFRQYTLLLPCYLWYITEHVDRQPCFFLIAATYPSERITVLIRQIDVIRLVKALRNIQHDILHTSHKSESELFRRIVRDLKDIFSKLIWLLQDSQFTSHSYYDTIWSFNKKHPVHNLQSRCNKQHGYCRIWQSSVFCFLKNRLHSCKRSNSW